MKQPTVVWRAAMNLARGVTALLTRLEVTGAAARDIYDRPLILAANHISPFDPIVLTAACRMRGLSPAFMADREPFEAPVLGWLMRACGHIRVDRGTPAAPQALTGAVEALTRGRAVLIYPEGRISLDPGLWPERGKTGVGRLVLATGLPVVPVAVWGAHQIVPYNAPKGMWPMILRALRRRPAVRVRFGPPVDLSAVDVSGPGAAQRVTDRIIDAVTAELVPLRPDEPGLPRFTDPTRPTETRRTHRPAAGRGLPS